MLALLENRWQIFGTLAKFFFHWRAFAATGAHAFAGTPFFFADEFILLLAMVFFAGGFVLSLATFFFTGVISFLLTILIHR
jgi:hypothetical protein